MLHESKNKIKQKALMLSPSDPHLSVSKVVEDGGQLLGDGVLALSGSGRVGVPPVDGEPVEPHVGLLLVRLLQARLEAVHLAAGSHQVALQGAVAHAQPAAQGPQTRRLSGGEQHP